MEEPEGPYIDPSRQHCSLDQPGEAQQTGKRRQTWLEKSNFWTAFSGHPPRWPEQAREG
jgi:hypothetical protein